MTRCSNSVMFIARGMSFRRPLELLRVALENAARGIDDRIEVDDLDAMLGADADLVWRQSAVPVLPLHVVLRLQFAKDGFGIELVDVGVTDETNGVDDHRAV